MTSFGSRLKTARVAARMTQAELALKVARSRVTVTNWELGSQEPDIRSIRLMCQALGVTADYLIGADALGEKGGTK